MLRHESALGMHHFAFLRSWFLKLDLREAWRRYLAFADLNDDLRHIERRRVELLGRVLDAGHQLNLSLPAEEQITAQLTLLAQPPFSPSTAPLPSLADFAAAHGLDPEFHSEAELLDEYRAYYHLDTVAEDAPDRLEVGAVGAEGVQAQVRALHQVQALLARAPLATDRHDLWLSPALSGRLKAAGIGTLGTLADTVRVYGWHWHRRVKALGATRAARLVDWLAPLAESFGQPIPESARQAPQRRRALRGSVLRDLVIPPRFGLVPLELLAVPPHLAGGAAAPGRFATRSPNHLGASDDLQAIRAWLASHEESVATHRAYAKEVERFYLWCLQVASIPLSSIDSADCLAYRRFLADLPAEWVNPMPVPRSDPAWRPFRGRLSPASQKYALVVVQAMFDGLAAANWLVGNPMRAVGKRALVPPGATPLERSFTDAEWAFVGTQVRWMVDGQVRGAGRRGPAEARRILLLLELLASTGLRLAEAAGATLQAVAQVPVEGEALPAHVLTVVGKGNKRREVPLDQEVLALIAQHHRDALRAIGPTSASALPSPTPLVLVLAPRPPRWEHGVDGSVALQSVESAQAPLTPDDAPGQGGRTLRGLSASGIYRILKRFFVRIAEDAHLVDGLSRERLLAASTHWLRHTFGRQGAAAGVPVEVLRQAFGHASLATTSLYLTTERSRMITELRKMRRFGG